MIMSLVAARAGAILLPSMLMRFISTHGTTTTTAALALGDRTMVLLVGTVSSSNLGTLVPALAAALTLQDISVPSTPRALRRSNLLTTLALTVHEAMFVLRRGGLTTNTVSGAVFAKIMRMLRRSGLATSAVAITEIVHMRSRRSLATGTSGLAVSAKIMNMLGSGLTIGGLRLATGTRHVALTIIHSKIVHMRSRRSLTTGTSGLAILTKVMHVHCRLLHAAFTNAVTIGVLLIIHMSVFSRRRLTTSTLGLAVSAKIMNMLGNLRVLAARLIAPTTGRSHRISTAGIATRIGVYRGITPPRGRIRTGRISRQSSRRSPGDSHAQILQRRVSGITRIRTLHRLGASVVGRHRTSHRVLKRSLDLLHIALQSRVGLDQLIQHGVFHLHTEADLAAGLQATQLDRHRILIHAVDRQILRVGRDHLTDLPAKHLCDLRRDHPHVVGVAGLDLQVIDRQAQLLGGVRQNPRGDGVLVHRLGRHSGRHTEREDHAQGQDEGQKLLQTPLAGTRTTLMHTNSSLF